MIFVFSRAAIRTVTVVEILTVWYELRTLMIANKVHYVNIKYQGFNLVKLEHCIFFRTKTSKPYLKYYILMNAASYYIGKVESDL